MSCYLIYYDHGAKKMRAVASGGEYRTLRNGEKQREYVRRCRQGESDYKRRLLQMNYSCLPDPAPQPSPGGVGAAGATATDGWLKGAKRASTTVGMDIDFVPDDPDYAAKMAAVPTTVLAKRTELGLLMLERSVTKGYHLVFRRRPGLTQEENLRWASDLLGVKYDEGAKDITRVFFTTTAEPDDLIFLDEELFATSAAPASAAAASAAAPAAAADANDKEEKMKPDEAPLTYLGIPYTDIIGRWWELYNGGAEPCEGNRNTLTFELAVNLRHICGFDRELLCRVIPDYWHSDPASAEKRACIDSALAERRTQMPRRLKDVIASLRQDLISQGTTADMETVSAIDAAAAQDELYHYDRLPRLPQGVRESVDAAGHTLAMPTMIAIAPAIGALATGVKLDVHGAAKGLNLCSFVVGEFASGKGQMDDVIAAWMYELQAETDLYTQQEEEWAAKTKRMKSGKAPEQPKLPVRMLTLNNTVANIAERLANTEGKHCYSFTPEADSVALKWKQTVSDFSVMLRQAYDEARYDREAKSADAVRVHIPKLLWNVTMCGTQDALYRVITNYTDGLLSRLSIARTADNTFAPLPEQQPHITDLQHERIQQVAHLLPLMEGVVVLPKLEERGRQWLETIRLEAMKNDDRVLARQRMRGCVNAQRITAALWLPKVAEMLIDKYGLNGAALRLKHDPGLWIDLLRRQQTDEMMRLFDLVADYLIDNDLYFFRDRIESAYESKSYKGNAAALRGRRGRNDSIFARLAAEFTFEQALQHAVAVKGTSATRNSVHQMLKNWRHQALVVCTAEGRYRKNPAVL